MSYKNESGNFTVPLNEEGGETLKLFYQRWIPNDGAKPETHNVVIHHGVGEHSDRYGNVLSMLEGTGVTVYSYDVRGHGRSEGKQGLIKDFYQLANDLDLFLNFIAQEHKVTKPILYGHSMGGATVLTYLGQSKEHQAKVKAVVSTAPALGVDKTCYQTVIGAILPCLNKIAPNLCLDSGLDDNNLSTDKNAVEAYKSDKMVHGMISVSMGLSFMVGGPTIIIPSAREMTIPLLLAHGEDDKICTPRGSQEYFDLCASKDKTLKLYPGLFHEIHNEVPDQKEKVLADIKKFITDHL